MTMTPTQRSMRARLAAYSKHAQTDARESTAPAREAFLDKFTAAVDPRGELGDAERQRRATALKRAYFARLALRSSRARSKKSPRQVSPTGDRGAAGHDGNPTTPA